MALATRGAALAVCLGPLAVLAVRAAVGLDALRPWRDWTCVLPLFLFVDVCPRLGDPAASAPFPGDRPPRPWRPAAWPFWPRWRTCRPLASAAWLLAIGCGALNILLMTAMLLMQPGRRDGDPAPPWMGNSLGTLLVLFAAAAAIQIGRLARRPARSGGQRPPGTQG